MKTIICFIAGIVFFCETCFSQSVINYQSGSGIEIQPGADVCSDTVILNGALTGGGSICSSTIYSLNLTSIVQGFYNAVSNTMIPDTMKVFLRIENSPYAKVDSSKNVMDGSNRSFPFYNAVNGSNYYVVLTHRNSIETWSRTGITFLSGNLVYDFTTSANKAFGSNQVLVNPNLMRFAVYSGDENQDGTVDLSDLINVFNDANNFATGYLTTDMNGDEFVDLTDLIITFNNSTNFVSVISP